MASSPPAWVMIAVPLMDTCQPEVLGSTFTRDRHMATLRDEKAPGAWKSLMPDIPDGRSGLAPGAELDCRSKLASAVGSRRVLG